MQAQQLIKPGKNIYLNSGSSIHKQEGWYTGHDPFNFYKNPMENNWWLTVASIDTILQHHFKTTPASLGRPGEQTLVDAKFTTIEEAKADLINKLFKHFDQLNKSIFYLIYLYINLKNIYKT